MDKAHYSLDRCYLTIRINGGFATCTNTRDHAGPHFDYNKDHQWQ